MRDAVTFHKPVGESIFQYASTVSPSTSKAVPLPHQREVLWISAQIKKSHTALAVWDENSAVPPKFSTKRKGFCGLFLLLCNGSARL